MAISANLATVRGPGLTQDVSSMPKRFCFDLTQPAVVASGDHTLTRLMDIPNGTVIDDLEFVVLKVPTPAATSTLLLQLIDTDDVPDIQALNTGVDAAAAAEENDAATIQLAAGTAKWAVDTGYVIPLLATGLESTAALFARMDQTVAPTTVGAIWRIGICAYRNIRP